MTQQKIINTNYNKDELFFPFDIFSEIAEIESWRKEIYRPIYHTHKWWAQRLGSIFRGLILSSALPHNIDIYSQYSKDTDLKGIVVYDPFMGSGTTIGEAIKLGCSAIGRDINPVAYNIVKTSLLNNQKNECLKAFHEIEANVSDDIKNLYKTKIDNQYFEVLYYFWVKFVECPDCSSEIDLFSSYIFSKHAYSKKHSKVNIVCPKCYEIIESDINIDIVKCHCCNHKFNPHVAKIESSKISCEKCNKKFKILDLVKNVPKQKMYAKMYLDENGNKKYSKINEYDLKLYEECKKKIDKIGIPIAKIEIKNGYNTKQVLNYGYKYWHEFFNERQLLSLNYLVNEINKIKNDNIRDAFAILFCGVLEFNNTFASFKGEGTGAVRHMFSNHILKPERTPIEANVWGTPKSSGSFSTLFKSRLIKSIEYKENPFEIKPQIINNIKKSEKIYLLNNKKLMNVKIANNFKEFNHNKNVYLSCGDSSKTDINDKTVDLVVTDPPFFDNVHYSELADFFFVWHKLFFKNVNNTTTTRSINEVQDTEHTKFSCKLTNVFKECNRVLKDNGFLVFSYHHSKQEGWLSLAESIINSGFNLIKCFPVKSELSVATPKLQAKNPINTDIIMICQKSIEDFRKPKPITELIISVKNDVDQKINKLVEKNIIISKNDIQILFNAQLLVELAPLKSFDVISKIFTDIITNNKTFSDNIIENIINNPIILKTAETNQLPLF